MKRQRKQLKQTALENLDCSMSVMMMIDDCTIISADVYVMLSYVQKCSSNNSGCGLSMGQFATS